MLSFTLVRGHVAGVLTTAALLSGCQMFNNQPASRPSGPPVAAATDTFVLSGPDDDVVGHIQRIHAREEDTLSDLARRFNLGYEEIVHANPTVDPWLPKAGTEVVLPTRFVLPDAPHTGIVVNLAAMRLYYFPKHKPGEPQRVITHPVGIGREHWETPKGLTHVVAKKANPTWTPTPSIRREHARNGDPLPKVVPAGEDNPMGLFALRLGWAQYDIHGTNKPPSIGLRGTHGCMRMYPEDIARIFPEVPVGTPVRVVDQPTVVGWKGNTLYVQTFPALAEDKRNRARLTARLLQRALAEKRASAGKDVPLPTPDAALVADLEKHPRALAMPVTQAGLTVPKYIAAAPLVANQLPRNATWDGGVGQQLSSNQDTEAAATQPQRKAN